MNATLPASRRRRGSILGLPWQGGLGFALFLAWGLTLTTDRDAWWHWALGGTAVAWLAWGAIVRRGSVTSPDPSGPRKGAGGEPH